MCFRLRFQSLPLRMTFLCDAFVFSFRRHRGTALRTKFLIPYLTLHSALRTLHSALCTLGTSRCRPLRTGFPSRGSSRLCRVMRCCSLPISRSSKAALLSGRQGAVPYIFALFTLHSALSGRQGAVPYISALCILHY